LYTSLRSLPILGPVADGPVVVPVARWRWLTAWWPRYRWPGGGGWPPGGQGTGGPVAVADRLVAKVPVARCPIGWPGLPPSW